MDWLSELLHPLDTFSHIPLYSVGDTTITLGTVLYLTILVVALFYSTAKLKTWIVERLLSRSHVDLGVRHAIGAIVRYIVVALGLIIILQTAGINLSTLTVLFGALGIGVGFGLQSITNNFVSGIILLLERPIKVGDRIEVGDVHGDVVNISPRATTIVTNDNIAIIVPNADFISSKVVNWSYTNRDVRFNFPVGVSYSSDPEQVRRVLLEVAQAHRGVLKEPGPSVLFDGFGDSSLDFLLRVWTREFSTVPGVLRSELYFAISRAFKEEGIEIPFPQRDLHIKSGTLNVRQVSSS
ncbi:MAG: mechanosensitive ion channel [Nitrospira sp.]|nr:mechanosensitive ion channel [Nitrospira sp.]MDH4369876.1 mechanosensitive ion channel [Nitrospira sp.]MDH5348132.1 mechanosensitive ion channel [Nitrospira sp.]MDH5498268.1 mechanosensitive ion channel [Nitrospira sp.]MDH5724631.1 mechanosensitive ion channel [Nitrospira sp.]